MDMDKKLIYGVLLVALLIVLAGYSLNIKSIDNIKENALPADDSKPQQVTKTISIGTVGDDAVKQIKRFQPTADYIAARLSNNETKYEGRVIIAQSVDNITDLLKEQKLDLYVESPFATVMAAKKSGSVPFLRRWKDGEPEYHSVFIVKNDSSINTLADFIGKTIAFEDPGSTSGYLLPKAHLNQKGLNLSQEIEKNHIRYVFSGEDENTPLWVVEGKVDIGVVSNLNFEALPESVKSKLKIIDRTIDVPRHVVSHRSEMDPAVVERVKQILLNMDKDPQGIEVLKNFQKTKKYDEISDKDEIFTSISKMIDALD